MSNQPKLAHHITIAKCECGCDHIGILLWDDQDHIFAAASFSAEEARSIALDLTEVAACETVVGHA